MTNAAHQSDTESTSEEVIAGYSWRQKMEIYVLRYGNALQAKDWVLSNTLWDKINKHLDERDPLQIFLCETEHIGMQARMYNIVVDEGCKHCMALHQRNTPN